MIGRREGRERLRSPSPPRADGRGGSRHPGGDAPPAAPADRPNETLPDDRRILRLAMVAVVVSLVLLVAVPVIVERQVARIGLDELEVVDLAGRETIELAFGLDRGLAALRNGPDGGAAYTAAESRVVESVRRVDELRPRLPAASQREWDVLREAVGRWESALDSLRRESGPSPAIAPETALELPPEYGRVLDGLTGFRASLDAGRVELLDEVARAERYGLLSRLGLALIALSATALVVWLGRRARKYAERARSEQREAVRANEARTRLMRGFSHDLKNPLGTVTLAADMLEAGIHGPLSDEQRIAVERVHRAASEGLALLEDLVELSKAEAGQLQLEPVRIDPDRLLRELVEELSGRAAASGLTLALAAPVEVPELVTDERRVRQILGNLAGNAIRYTPRGGRITVGATVHEERSGDRGGAWVLFSVDDTGPGIPPDQVDHIFEEFVRLSPDDRTGGSGIGLAISRQLARLMGGDLRVDTEVGRGSTFTLWLPLTRPQPRAARPEERAATAASNSPAETPDPTWNQAGGSRR